MALYEPENKGPADIKRALAIEQDAWETAALLGEDSDEEAPCGTVPEPSEMPAFAGFDDATEGDFAALVSALDGETRRALGLRLPRRVCRVLPRGGTDAGNSEKPNQRACDGACRRHRSG